MSTTTTTTLFADLASALWGGANRATVIRLSVAAKRDGITEADLYAGVNAQYVLKSGGVDLKASVVKDGAVKQRVQGYELLERLNVPTESTDDLNVDDLLNSAVNLASKGLAQFIAQVEEGMTSVKSTSPKTRHARATKLIAQAIADANAERKRRAQERLANEPEESEGEGEQSTDTPSKSLVDVILQNMAALDYAGLTDDERNRLLDAFEAAMPRIINAK